MINQFENIDRYFGGEMNAKEMQNFESVVKQDPLLEKEFSFQQELIEGIQATRKIELKANLSNVDVTGGSVLESSTLTKILGGVAVAGVVAVGAYLYLGDEEMQQPTIASQEQVINPQGDVNEAIVIKEEATSEANYVPEEVPPSSSITEEVIPNADATSAKSVVISEANVTEGFDDDEEVSETAAPINYLITKSKVNISSLGVTVKESKRYTFHYQVKNSTLLLYGDFSNIYDIIEFHKDENTKTYLKYSDKYYKIDKLQSKATPLVELTGDALLNLLDNIENNKER